MLGREVLKYLKEQTGFNLQQKARPFCDIKTKQASFLSIREAGEFFNNRGGPCFCST